MQKRLVTPFLLLIPLMIFGFSTVSQASSQNNHLDADAPASLLITEFMASANDNDGTRDIADEDGDKPDWIEIYNDTERVVNLAGWSLTDDERMRQKWTFPPDTLLGPRRYLIIFASGKDRSVSSSELHTNFKLKRTGEYLALIDDQNQTVSEVVGRYPTQYTGISYGLEPQITSSGYSKRWRYFVNPTPGTLNTFNSGPSIVSVDHKPHRVDAEVGMAVKQGENIVVTAIVDSAVPLAEVLLEYKFGFGESKQTPLLFRGSRTYSTLIPSADQNRGTLVRYVVRAIDQNGRQSQWPLLRNQPEDSPDYIRSPHFLGTVIGYEEIDQSSRLPILHWFVEPDPLYGWEWFRGALDQHRRDFEERYPDPATRPAYDAWSFNDVGTSAVLFYNGKLYDNIFVRLRGKSVKNFEKKSFKFKFNKNYRFFFKGTEDPDDPFQGNVHFTELNINTIGRDSNGNGDESYLREMLAWRAYRATGVPYPLNFPLRLDQNGQFFSVSLFVEEIEERFLERQDLSTSGSLFKVDHNDLGIKHIDTRRNITDHSNLFAIEQKMPKRAVENRISLVSELIENINLDSEQRTARERSDVTEYLFQHVDIAGVINYLATRTVIDDWDTIRHNYWLYHDSGKSDEWTIIPWDKNETFPYPLDPTSEREHPLYGSWAMYNRVGEPPPGLLFNRLIDAIFQDTTLRAMYLRRVKSVMDLLLGEPFAPNETSPLSQQNIARYKALLDADIQQFDLQRWGMTFDSSNLSNHIAERRLQLYDQNNYNSMIPLDLLTPSSGIRFGLIVRSDSGTITLPNGMDEDPDQPELTGEIEAGLEEVQQPFLTLINCSFQAVDLSNWSIKRKNGRSITLKAGVVLPGLLHRVDALYIMPDVAKFRAQAAPVFNDYPRFVQGGFDPSLLGDDDEILFLFDAEGNEITNSNQPTLGCPVSAIPNHGFLPMIRGGVQAAR